MLLGVVLGVVGLRRLREVRPRSLGAAALALALLIPLSARALTLVTFTNGTVADANQINANFAALVPVSGINTMQSNGAGSFTGLLATPTFVAPRAMTCTVSADSWLRASLTDPPPRLDLAKIENDVGAVTHAAPSGSSQPTPYASADHFEYTATQTRQFLVGAGHTIAFGCATGGGFDGLAVIEFASCTIVYNCL